MPNPDSDALPNPRRSGRHRPRREDQHRILAAGGVTDDGPGGLPPQRVWAEPIEAKHPVGAERSRRRDRDSSWALAAPPKPNPSPNPPQPSGPTSQPKLPAHPYKAPEAEAGSPSKTLSGRPSNSTLTLPCGADEQPPARGALGAQGGEAVEGRDREARSYGERGEDTRRELCGRRAI